MGLKSLALCSFPEVQLIPGDSELQLSNYRVDFSDVARSYPVSHLWYKLGAHDELYIVIKYEVHS